LQARGLESRGLPLMPELDAKDMTALCLGDEQAFRRVVRRHQKRVLAYCLRMLGDTSHAQDTAQDVFLTLWRERKSYREQGKLEFFLLGIARLRCLALLKKLRAQRRLQDRAMEIQRTRAQARIHDSNEDAHLQSAMARLKGEHRDLLVLRHFEGLDLTEIASVTGLRIGTIKSRLHRGLSALRKELEDVE
jgi:RNA polymerase sigma-70 factor (ECF subfamily)